MLQTMEEVRTIEQNAIINGVDNPGLMSVDSTESIKTNVDEIKEEKTEQEVKTTEKKEEVTTESEIKEEKPAVDEKSQVPLKETPVKGADKRIGELTKKWRSTERELNYERTKRLEVENKLKELSAKIPTEGRPNKEDFDDEESYFEALTDWKIESKLKNSREEVELTKVDESEKKAVTAVYDDLDTVMERGRKKYKDFTDLVLAEDLILPTEVLELTLQSDIPEDVLYYLASHSEESAEMSLLSPTKAAIKIGVLAAKLALEDKKDEDVSEVKEEPPLPPKPPVVKKQTNAPAPINPVRTTGVTEKDPASMSPKEYRAWRERNKE